MAEVSQIVVVLFVTALFINLIQHGWPGVRAKLSAIFLGQPRPDLIK